MSSGLRPEEEKKVLKSLKAKLSAGVRLITINEAALYLSQNPGTFKKRVARREDGLPVVVFSKRSVMIDLRGLDEWVDSRKAKRLKAIPNLGG